MHVDSADIRFQCAQCGQHLVVESAAEGLLMDCPICKTNITVPAPSHGASGAAAGKDGKKRQINASTGEQIAPFADSGAEFLREELIDASLMNGKLGTDLSKARDETARLQQRLKELGDEHERLYASATHAQRELKTFQAERQQSKSEAATLRQRLSAADEALAMRVAEAEHLRQALAASQYEHAEAAQAWSETNAHLVAAEQLVEESRVQQNELGGKLAAAEQAHAAALERLAETATLLTASEGDLDRTLKQLDEAIAAREQESTSLRGELRQAGERFAEAETQLREERAKLLTASDENRALTERVEQLRRDVEALRGDLKESQAGREIIEIRDQLTETTAERERQRQRAEAVEATLAAANLAAEKIRAELEETREARDAARTDAQTLRDSVSLKDNEILRGIVARLNADLVQRTAESARMKRAQYSLKVVYGIFGIGLLAVLALALKVLPRFMH